ncbi:MAG TPA: AI-2E family transporter [Xanthobacteraceae bacterium]|jgi:predicted PurR-regulated permease PerM
MSFNRPIVFWIALLLVLVIAVALLREVLLPFVTGMVLAYLLNPMAQRMERRGMNRLVATLVIIALVVAIITALIILIVPVIVRELSYFIDSFPLYVRQLRELASDPRHPWVGKIVGQGLGEAERSFGELTSLATTWFGTFLRSVWSGGRALISVLSLGVVAPIVACYLLYDWNRMVATVDNWVPPVHRDVVHGLAREIDETIGGFVRGQSVLCLVLAVFYAATLWGMGLKHGALIGFAAGLLSFIPYLGSLSGLIISLCVAVAQFWPDWRPIALVPAVFFVGQSLGDYVLAPYLVGRRIHLNPVWIMFALFAFGYLFGFVGLLIAVPLAAAIGVLMRFVLRQYYASPIYKAPPPPLAGQRNTELSPGRPIADKIDAAKA